MIRVMFTWSISKAIEIVIALTKIAKIDMTMMTKCTHKILDFFLVASIEFSFSKALA